MQNAAYFSGYNTDKPSSRVLAPPGGGSSDIFGSNDTHTNGSSNGTSNGHTNGTNGHHATAAAVTQSPPKTDAAVPQHILNRQQALANKMKNASASGGPPSGEIRLAQTMKSKDGVTEPPTRSTPEPTTPVKPKEESPAPQVQAPVPEPPKQVEESPKKAEEPAPAPVTPKKEESPAPQLQQMHITPPKPKRTGYNPITGESYEDEDSNRTKNYQANDKQREQKQAQVKEHQAYMTSSQAPAAGCTSRMKEETAAQQQQAQQQQQKEAHTFSRVSQPPGGRSTKLW